MTSRETAASTITQTLHRRMPPARLPRCGCGAESTCAIRNARTGAQFTFHCRTCRPTATHQKNTRSHVERDQMIQRARLRLAVERSR